MADRDGYQGGQRPKSTFLTYVAEGDQLYHKGEYVKAIESYSTVSAQANANGKGKALTLHTFSSQQLVFQ